MPVPEFVLALRAQLGTDQLWLPGVAAVVLDDDGRVLLGRRADNGLWAVVSGILEPGEQPAPAAVRECAEETGVHAEVVALTSVTVSEPVTYPNGDRALYLDVCFWCRAVGGEARVADDESTEVGWFAPTDLPEPLAESSRQRLEHTLAFVAEHAAGRNPQPFFVR